LKVQLVSSLSDCSEAIQREKPTWRLDDQIITKQNFPQMPYYFIPELRQRNDTLGLKDDKFYENRRAPACET
jgi:hypothetical protein